MATKKQSKAEKRAAAEARAAALRKAQEAKERRTRMMIIVGALALIALVAVSVVLIMQQASKPELEKMAHPANSDAQGGFWIKQDGSVAQLDKSGADPNAKGVVMDVYYDYMCHFCVGFETLYKDQIDKLRADGSVSLVLHPINNLSQSASDASSKAAMAIAETGDKDPTHFYAFHEGLIAWQYQQMGAPKTLLDTSNAKVVSFTESDFTTLATSAGVSSTAQAAFTSDEFYKWVSASYTQARLNSPKIDGTPAVYLRKAGQPFSSAKVWQPSYDDTSDLAKAVADVAAGKTPPPRSTAAATPAATSIPVPETTPTVSVGK